LGIPVGVKTAGGILDLVLREVEIECLPADIPSHIDVDVSNMNLFDVIRVSDLPHSDKIKYLNEEDATVAHVVAIREEAAPAAEADAVAAAGTAAEPEVAKKGKTDADAAKKPEAGAKKPEGGAKK
jgi:large subunit ribosomal protein L25